jgi:hypothetical protein
MLWDCFIACDGEIGRWYSVDIYDRGMERGGRVCPLATPLSRLLRIDLV